MTYPCLSSAPDASLWTRWTISLSTSVSSSSPSTVLVAASWSSSGGISWSRGAGAEISWSAGSARLEISWPGGLGLENSWSLGEDKVMRSCVSPHCWDVARRRWRRHARAGHVGRSHDNWTGTLAAPPTASSSKLGDSTQFREWGFYLSTCLYVLCFVYFSFIGNCSVLIAPRLNRTRVDDQL